MCKNKPGSLYFALVRIPPSDNSFLHHQVSKNQRRGGFNYYRYSEGNACVMSAVNLQVAHLPVCHVIVLLFPVRV